MQFFIFFIFFREHENCCKIQSGEVKVTHSYVTKIFFYKKLFYMYIDSLKVI